MSIMELALKVFFFKVCVCVCVCVCVSVIVCTSSLIKYMSHL